MRGRPDESSVPDPGEIVGYDGAFHSPEAPIIPVANGTGSGIVRATRRVLDAATDTMGRDIHWLPIDIGGESDANGDWLPEDAVRTLKQYRIGLIGPLASNRPVASRRQRELYRRVGVTNVCNQFSPTKWNPIPLRIGDEIDLTLFRDVSDNAASTFHGDSRDRRAEELHDVPSSATKETDVAPREPTGFRVRSVSESATSSLVKSAMDFALDRDRRSVTIAHQADGSDPSDRSFLERARECLSSDYAEAVVDESTFRSDLDGRFPEDEIVVLERHIDDVLRQLLTKPDQFDVVIAAGPGGRSLSTVAGEVAGGRGVTPTLLLGDGRLLAHSQRREGGQTNRAWANPIGLLLASCLLLEYIGWDDVVTTIHRAISETLADGVLPRDLHRPNAHTSPATVDEFVEALVERINAPEREPGAGGRRTTAVERSMIQATIAGVYNTLFEDQLAARDIELNQLFGEDEEADVYLPEVGLNFYYWRRWPAERRLEVLLHELAHVEQLEGERDHGSEFYDRLVELTELAADWKPELEVLFGEPIDFRDVQRSVVESVHEDTIEPDLESVQARKRILCNAFDIDPGRHY